jgi:predicted small lipoprotein YifL
MRLAIGLLLAALLTACGFKGPLYLPKPEAQPVKPAPQQTPPKAGMPEPVSQ